MSMPVKFALPFIKRVRERNAEYEEECRRWAERGYRPHYCIHGADLWVDWDCVCGWCEESLTLYEEALAWAHQAWDRKQEATSFYIEVLASAEKHYIPSHVRYEIVEVARKYMVEAGGPPF